MKVSNTQVYAFKRFLFTNKAIVIPMNERGIHPELKIDYLVLKALLKTYVSKGYIAKIGNWQHIWYPVTEEGEIKLKDEVELPAEFIAQEQLEIKN